MNETARPDAERGTAEEAGSGADSGRRGRVATEAIPNRIAGGRTATFVPEEDGWRRLLFSLCMLRLIDFK